jgi:hypothetical protein
LFQIFSFLTSADWIYFYCFYVCFLLKHSDILVLFLSQSPTISHKFLLSRHLTTFLLLFYFRPFRYSWFCLRIMSSLSAYWYMCVCIHACVLACGCTRTQFVLYDSTEYRTLHEQFVSCICYGIFGFYRDKMCKVSQRKLCRSTSICSEETYHVLKFPFIFLHFF